MCMAAERNKKNSIPQKTWNQLKINYSSFISNNFRYTTFRTIIINKTGRQWSQTSKKKAAVTSYVSYVKILGNAKIYYINHQQTLLFADYHLWHRFELGWGFFLKEPYCYMHQITNRTWVQARTWLFQAKFFLICDSQIRPFSSRERKRPNADA